MKIEFGKLYNFKGFVVESDDHYPVYADGDLELIEHIKGYDPFIVLSRDINKKLLKVLTIKGTIGNIYSTYRFERILKRYHEEDWIND